MLVPHIERQLAEAGAPPPGHHRAAVADVAPAVRDPSFHSALLAVVGLRQRLQEGAAGASTTRKALRKTVTKRLAKLHAHSLRSGVTFAQLDELQRHCARKRLKRLRYLAELMRPLYAQRHAEAEDLAEGDDMLRPLTARGEKHAQRMAAWLDRNLPDGARVLSSPALRCEQTAQRLGRKYKMADELAPDAAVAALLEAAHWPSARHPVVMVGHQPLLGQVVSHLLRINGGSCAFRKGSVWWLRTRERDGHEQTVVWAVLTAELV